LAVGLPLLAVGMLLFSGCSQSEPSVRGTVLVDGEPLANGSIHFFPVDDKGAIANGRGPGSGTIIKEGTYEIPKGNGLTVGRYLVKIQGVRPTPKPGLDPVLRTNHIHEEVSAVPPEYNQKSTLIREVQAGLSIIDFRDIPGTRKNR
jgi:hypothetical protein